LTIVDLAVSPQGALAPRDVLDTLHQFYEFLAMLGLAGREVTREALVA
jgi:hypothetical protein